MHVGQFGTLESGKPSRTSTPRFFFDPVVARENGKGPRKVFVPCTGATMHSSSHRPLILPLTLTERSGSPFAECPHYRCDETRKPCMRKTLNIWTLLRASRDNTGSLTWRTRENAKKDIAGRSRFRRVKYRDWPWTSANLVVQSAMKYLENRAMRSNHAPKFLTLTP
jgi:hypothetical protein